MNVPQEALFHLRKRSREARGWAEFEKSGRKKLGVWKKYLSQNQIKSILDIVHQFGLSEFTDRIEPDYNLLYRKHT